jgi:small subunit ribosomal protein S18
MTAAQETVEYERQMTRKWKDGDVYAPHDLSGVEMAKWSKGQAKGRPKKDVFDMLKINPLNHYWVCFVQSPKLESRLTFSRTFP